MHASYSADNLRVQLGFSHPNSRNISPLDDVKAQLCLRAAKVNVKNSERAGIFSTSMFYSEKVASLNDLENIKKARDEKYPKLVELLEVELRRGTGKKA